MNKEDEDYEDSEDEEKNRSKLTELKRKSKLKEINEEDILPLDITDDEKIWFIDHLKVFKHISMYSIEWLEMRDMIYNRYIESLKQNKEVKEIEEKIKNLSGSNKSIIERILTSKHSDEIKAMLYKKYKDIDGNDKADEYYKVIDLIKTVLEIPTEIKIIKNSNNVEESIFRLKMLLDRNVYGMINAKERILEIYCAMLINPEYKNSTIGFVGEPGVGKSILARTIAQAMELPFEQISMGSIKDATTLIGHSYTYIGAHAGLFVNLLRKMKVLNGIIFMDEIDKIPNTPDGLSIYAVLIHVLDKIQNNRFQDSYIPEIPINLSNIMFIVAMNDDNQIDPIVKDRIHLIKIESYTTEDKINIGIDYLLPIATTNIKINKKDIIINKDVMKYIITRKPIESGVRQLEKDLNTLCERINVLKHLNKKKKKIKLSYYTDIKFPFYITKEDIDILLN